MPYILLCFNHHPPIEQDHNKNLMMYKNGGGSAVGVAEVGLFPKFEIFGCFTQMVSYLNLPGQLEEKLPQELFLKFPSEIIMQRSLSPLLLLRLSENCCLSWDDTSTLYLAMAANNIVVQKVARVFQAQKVTAHEKVKAQHGRTGIILF